MFVYFAHPIDQVGPSRSRTIEDIAQTLNRAGISAYRPGSAFSLVDPRLADLEAVDRINRFALATADALVAWLPGGVATLGVPSEIEDALNWGKPVVILTTSRIVARSVQMANWRGRGASIETWTDSIARHWEHNPNNLLDLLRRSEVHRVVRPSDDLLVQLNPAAKTPSRAYQDDAGLDLAILHEERLAAGEYRMLPTGIQAAVPSGWWGMITGRSSTWAKHRCDVRLAVIDAGYRGELMIGIENRGDSAMVFEAGTRLAQYVLIPTFSGHVQQVDQLPEAHRGVQGYGSSGR